MKVKVIQTGIKMWSLAVPITKFERNQPVNVWIQANIFLVIIIEIT